MDELFVFVDEQTTCFHYLFYYKLIGMFLPMKFIKQIPRQRYCAFKSMSRLNKTTALPMIKVGVY